jgi:endonuclease-8
MPEGDTIHGAAALLSPYLLGKVVRTLELPRRAQVIDRVQGKSVTKIEARGKNLLIYFDDEIVLHTHMKMNGVWRAYAPDGKRPFKSGSVVAWLEVEDGSLAVCFMAPVVRLIRAKRVARDPHFAQLGPDPIDAGFDRDAALARLRARPEMPLGEALLDQRAIAGIGNVWKSELMFEHRLDPFAPVAAFTDDELALLLESAEKGMRRSARGAKRPARVYGRSAEPCLRCGELVTMRRQGERQRSTYYCATCQAPRSRP